MINYHKFIIPQTIILLSIITITNIHNKFITIQEKLVRYHEIDKIASEFQEENHNLSLQKARFISGSLIQYASDYKVRPRLLIALIKVESEADPKCLSNKGAVGIMQITKQTAADFINQGEDLMDIDVNIRIGTQILSRLINIYGERGALVRYLCGENNKKAFNCKLAKEYVKQIEELSQ